MNGKLFYGNIYNAVLRIQSAINNSDLKDSFKDFMKEQYLNCVMILRSNRAESKSNRYLSSGEMARCMIDCWMDQDDHFLMCCEIDEE